jgi:hypothetical protein
LASEEIPAETPAGLDGARFELRSVGYCVHCDALVERQADGTCPSGHPAEAVAGRMILAENDAVPVLPRFNLAAFLIPPIWGPAHGSWAGAIFLPIWLFADSAIVAAVRRGGVGLYLAAAFVVLGTLGFEYFFARRANGIAFRRVMGTMSLEEFNKRQRTWALISLPIAAALVGWGMYFDIILMPTLKP